MVGKRKEDACPVCRRCVFLSHRKNQTALIIVLVIALIIFGPGKLPELGKTLGKGITEFRSATSGEPDTKKLTEFEETQERPLLLTRSLILFRLLTS